MPVVVAGDFVPRRMAVPRPCTSPLSLAVVFRMAPGMKCSEVGRPRGLVVLSAPGLTHEGDSCAGTKVRRLTVEPGWYELSGCSWRPPLQGTRFLEFPPSTSNMSFHPTAASRTRAAGKIHGSTGIFEVGP